MSISRTTKVVVPANPGARPTEREVTVPGRSEPPRPVASPGELRTARFLVVITAVSGLAFAILAVVGFQLILVLLGREITPPPPECDDDTRPCLDDQFCQAGRCRTPPERQLCEAGDLCNTCTCEGPMLCQSGVCSSPEPTIEDVCDKPEIQKALARLEKECKGDLGRCDPGALNKFAMQYKGFDELLSAFPGTITLHFPTGKPPLVPDKATPWPNAKTRAHYIDRLARSTGVLRGAKFIFLIARSSPHGNARLNGLFAQQRGIYAKELLYATLDLETAERDAFSKKFREFILGPKRRLDRDLFAQRYENRFITWNTNSHKQLLNLIKTTEPITEKDAEWLDDTINQVVLIVPVHCELKTAPPGATE
jgi:hypothetical protein